MPGIGRSIADFFLGKNTKKAVGPNVSISADLDGDGWLSLGDTSTGNNLFSSTNLSAQISQFKSTVYALTSLLAQVAATIPVKLYYSDRNGDVIEVTDHLFLDLWHGVNKYTTNFEMVEMTITEECLTGNNYHYLIRNQLGYPIEMQRVPSPGMSPVIKGARPVGYYYNAGVGGGRIWFDFNDILQFKLPNPGNEFIGMSYVSAAAQAIALKNQIDTSERAGLNNMFEPSAVITLDEAVDDEEEFKRVLRAMNDAYVGASKRKKLVALSNVKELKTLDFPLKDFSFLKGRSNIRDELYSIWKVPLSFGGRENTSARATLEADRISLIEYGIKPMLIRMQEKINEFLLPQYDNGDGKLFCKFDVESAMPIDREFKLKERESNLKSGYSVPDEERAKNGEPPRPDGAGGVVFIPSNQIPASTAMNAVTISGASVASADPAGKSIQGKAKQPDTAGMLVSDIESLTKTQADQMRRTVKSIYRKIADTAIESLGEEEE